VSLPPSADDRRRASGARAPAWLVVVDMQAVFADPDSGWYTPDAATLVAPVAELAGAFAGRVVLTRFVAPASPQGAWAEYYRAWPFALQPPTAPLYRLLPGLPDGPVLDATTFSKWGPALSSLTGGAGELVLCGVATDCCVLMTALAAADAGVVVRVVGDACAAVDGATHRRALDLLRPYEPMIRVTSVAEELGGT
jgi:nicotinamidase-related amidase